MMFFIVVFLYFVPTIVALVHRGRDPGTAIVINLFLGWTLVGWVAALAIACRSRVEPIMINPQTILVTSSAQPVLPPQPLPSAGWYLDPSATPAIERYWDGATWTPATRQVPRQLP